MYNKKCSTYHTPHTSVYIPHCNIGGCKIGPKKLHWWKPKYSAKILKHIQIYRDAESWIAKYYPLEKKWNIYTQIEFD